MSERCLRLPLDFESRAWFRALAKRANVTEAISIVVGLFRDLGYAAENETLGFLPEAMAVTHVGLLEEVGLLRRVEEPAKGWHCDVFARMHPDLDAEYVSTAVKGGNARAVRLGWKRAQAEALEQSGSQDLQGLFGGMESPEVIKAMALVTLCDNTYKRVSRKPLEWTEGLRDDAKRLLANFSEEAIESVLTWVHGRVRSALMTGVPKNTEALLKEFETYVGKV